MRDSYDQDVIDGWIAKAAKLCEEIATLQARVAELEGIIAAAEKLFDTDEDVHWRQPQPMILSFAASSRKTLREWGARIAELEAERQRQPRHVEDIFVLLRSKMPDLLSSLRAMVEAGLGLKGDKDSYEQYSARMDAVASSLAQAVWNGINGVTAERLPTPPSTP